MIRLVFGFVAALGVATVIANKWFAEVFASANLSSRSAQRSSRKHRLMTGYARTIAILVGGLLCVVGVLGAIGIHR